MQIQKGPDLKQPIKRNYMQKSLQIALKNHTFKTISHLYDFINSEESYL